MMYVLSRMDHMLVVGFEVVVVFIFRHLARITSISYSGYIKWRR